MGDTHSSSVVQQMAKAVKGRRRTLIVNPRAQLRFVMSLSIPTLLILLSVCTWALWIDTNAYGDPTSTGAPEPLPSFLPLGVGLFVAILAFGGTMVVQALRISHRVEGAAVNLVKSMRRIREGDLDFTVKLRSKDHLQEVAAELNLLKDWIRTQLPTGRPGTRAAAPVEAPASPVTQA